MVIMGKVLNVSIIAGLLFFWSASSCQISRGGIAPGIEYKLKTDDIDTKTCKSPNKKKFLEAGNYPGSYPCGKVIPVDFTLDNSGKWQKLPDGKSLWRLKIVAPDAAATSLYFNEFFLPEGAELFVYSENKSKCIGAFTHLNNHYTGRFATELISGDACILEFIKSEDNEEKAVINISGVNYAFGNIYNQDDSKGFGDAVYCMINVNCSEGDNWQDEKKGIARILLLSDGSTGWCSGSLVNNTAHDCTPYFLLAQHCHGGATASEMAQWIFYFNYEAAGCDNPGSEPSSQTITGSRFISDGPISGGSDYLLVQLDRYLPDTYNAFFNGWNRSNTFPTGTGVGIHHPAGDIKKISTYTITPSNIQYPYVGGENLAENSAWYVQFSTTTHGHSIIEGGSSGSPLFDPNGRIIGVASGGGASCSNPSYGNTYGKFYYHWDQNGPTDIERLKPWLDPNNTGVITLDGEYCDTIPAIDAKFHASVTTINKGQSVKFYNTSIIYPNSFARFTFEGGTPSGWIVNGYYKIVTYNTPGNYDVTLEITDPEYTGDTEYKADYITVLEGSGIHEAEEVLFTISPNPATDFIILGFPPKLSVSDANVVIYDISGKITGQYLLSPSAQRKEKIDISGLPDGFYYLTVKTPEYTVNKKFCVIQNP